MAPGYSATETSSVSLGGKSYDAHYLVGNYYQWNTVTAGSGIGLTSPKSASTNPNKLANAPSSICPKGWKLPTSGKYTNNGIIWPFDLEDSFYRLLYAYGYPETGSLSDPTAPVPGWKISATNPNVSMDGKTRIDYSPMYYVRSGIMNNTLGYLGNGLYWSSTITPATVVGSNLVLYHLNFTYHTIFPTQDSSQYGGFSARCLAR